MQHTGKPPPGVKTLVCKTVSWGGVGGCWLHAQPVFLPLSLWQRLRVARVLAVVPTGDWDSL